MHNCLSMLHGNLIQSCVAVNAFTIPWKFKMFYAFPPFSLVPRCTQKILQDKATGILITPFWTTQTWFAQLLQLTWHQPWILKQSTTLIQHPTKKGTTSNAQVVETDGLSCIRKSFKTAGVLTEVTHVLLANWYKETVTTLTLENGWSFVVKGKLISIHQQ